jgi:hypothetical protein
VAILGNVTFPIILVHSKCFARDYPFAGHQKRGWRVKQFLPVDAPRSNNNVSSRADASFLTGKCFTPTAFLEVRFDRRDKRDVE